MALVRALQIGLSIYLFALNVRLYAGFVPIHYGKDGLISQG